MVKYIYRPKLVSKPYICKERLPKAKCTLGSFIILNLTAELWKKLKK